MPAGAGDAEFLGALRDELTPVGRCVPPGVRARLGRVSTRTVAIRWADCAVTTDAYGAATRILRGIAERHAAGRLVSLLEGGYDLEALGASVVAHLEALADDAGES